MDGYIFEPKLDIDDFIKLHNPNDGEVPWKYYNESIITPDYKIIAAVPSHEQCLVRLVQEEQHVSKEELSSAMNPAVSPVHYIIEKYHYISLWYNEIIVWPGALMDSNITRMINKLFINNMLAPDILQHVDMAHDYTSSRFHNGEISYDEYIKYIQRINKKIS